MKAFQQGAAPSDRVVIFDEAQRAWNQVKTADFMARRKKRPGFTQTEPEFLISVLDRHIDWAVVICLVGGGQEINTGEAGISEWLDAIRMHFPEWHAYISPDLVDSEYSAGDAIDSLAARANVVKDSSLHLAVSMRSFRAGACFTVCESGFGLREWRGGEDTQRNVAPVSHRDYPRFGAGEAVDS